MAAGEALNQLVRSLMQRGHVPDYAARRAAGFDDLARNVDLDWWHGVGAKLPDALTLYHGTPYTFAPSPESPLGRFAIEQNLLRGEGANAFGPGAYLTGDEGLGREYANNLTRRLTRPMSDKQKRHKGYFDPASTMWGRAYTEDPGAFLEYLRLRDALRAEGYIGNRYYNQLPVYSRFEPGKRIAWDTGVGLLDGPGIKDYVSRRPYGLNVPPAIRGHGDVKEALFAGDRMRNVLAASPIEHEPTLIGRQVARARGNIWGHGFSGADAEFIRSLGPEVKRAPLADQGYGVVRGRLNASNAAIAGRPGPRYKYNMDTSIDLQGIKPEAAPKPDTSQYTPNLYVAQTDKLPGRDLFSYDYPLWTNRPALVSDLDRLYQLAAGGRRLDLSNTGQQALETVTNRVGPLNTLRAMRESNIPGMYYLKGGRRDYHRTGELPTQFDPKDYNFLFFDDNPLSIVDKRARGGAV